METLRVVALEGELEDDESMVLVVVVYIDWSMTRLSTMVILFVSLSWGLVSSYYPPVLFLLEKG